MSDTKTTTSTPETVVHRHPVRGLLWGLMFGIGLTLVLVLTKVISLDLTTMIIVAALGTATGVVWGVFGPAKPPGDPAPTPHADRTPPPVSRFDDFTDVRPAPSSEPAVGSAVGSADESAWSADESVDGRGNESASPDDD